LYFAVGQSIFPLGRVGSLSGNDFPATQAETATKARFAIRAKAAPAKLMDYYNPDLSAVLAPQTFSVESGPSQ